MQQNKMMRSSGDWEASASRSPRERSGRGAGGQQQALGGGGSTSRYAEIHAFHKKRTLASGFPEAQHVTQAGHRQFASKPRRAAQRGGEGAEVAGRTAASGFAGPSARRGGSLKARDGATQAMLVTASSQGGPGQAPFGSPARGAPGLGPLSTSQQQRESIQTLIATGREARGQVAGADGQTSASPEQRQTKQGQHDAMCAASLWSLGASAPAGGSPARGSNERAPLNVYSLQKQESSPAPRSGSRDHGPAPEGLGVKNVTITQNMHGGALGPKRAPAAHQPPVLQATIQRQQRPKGLSTLDQRLEEATRKSAVYDLDNSSRFLTFQGEQIGALKMALGPEHASAKRSTHFGGGHGSPGRADGYPHGKAPQGGGRDPAQQHLQRPVDQHRGKGGVGGGHILPAQPSTGQYRHPVQHQLRLHGQGEPYANVLADDNHEEVAEAADFAELHRLIDAAGDVSANKPNHDGRSASNPRQPHGRQSANSSTRAEAFRLQPFERDGSNDKESLLGLRVGSLVLDPEDKHNQYEKRRSLGVDQLGYQTQPREMSKNDIVFQNRTKEQMFRAANASKVKGKIKGKEQKQTQQRTEVTPTESNVNTTLKARSPRASQELPGELSKQYSKNQNQGGPSPTPLVNYATQGAERTKTADKFISKKLGGIPGHPAGHKGSVQAQGEAARMLNYQPSVESATKTPGSRDHTRDQDSRINGLARQELRLEPGAAGNEPNSQLAILVSFNEEPNKKRIDGKGATRQKLVPNIDMRANAGQQQYTEQSPRRQGAPREVKESGQVTIGLSPAVAESRLNETPQDSILVSDGPASPAAQPAGAQRSSEGQGPVAQQAPRERGLDVDGEPRPRMAVSIGHPDAPPAGAKARHATAEQEELTRHTESKQSDADLLDEDAEDPERAVLMRILEKMRCKHKLTSQVEKADYIKYRPRQWESIEDKLKALDSGGQQSSQYVSRNAKKDFVKQIQDHIKAIIKTGLVKGGKVSTQAAFLEQEQQMLGQQANVGIKLQQMRTTLGAFPRRGPESQFLDELESSRAQFGQGKPNFNDLRSSGDALHLVSNSMIDVNSARNEGQNPAAADSQMPHSRLRQPKHSRSVAPQRMQDQAALNGAVGLHAMDQSSARFQSNANIILVDPGKEQHLIGKQSGGHPHQASAPFVSHLAQQANHQQQKEEAKNQRQLTTHETDQLRAGGAETSRSAQFGVKQAQNLDQAANAKEHELKVQTSIMPLEKADSAQPSSQSGLPKPTGPICETLQSCTSKEDYPYQSSLFLQEQALSSTNDFHSQYNRHEDIIKFKMPVVTKRQAAHHTMGGNERLDEIHAKLKDPMGHLQLMERNAIVQNRHRGSSVERRNNFNPFTTVASMSISGQQSPMQDSIQSSVTQIRQPALLSSAARKDGKSATSQFMSAGSPAALPTTSTRAAPNLLATARHQSKTNFPSPGRPTRTSVFDGHPMEAKLTYMRDKYLKGKLVDPLAIEYGNFPGANQAAELQKPRMSEWMRKEVMLPILGKNKTSLLHSSAQLDVESIAQQKSCLNRPAKHATDQAEHGPSATSKRGFGFRALHNTSDTTKKTSERKETSKTTSPGAPKKLTATLKQQAKNVQNQEKEQERHLMQQIEKVAQLMAIAATKPAARAESVEPETPMPSLNVDQMAITQNNLTFYKSTI